MNFSDLTMLRLFAGTFAAPSPLGSRVLISSRWKFVDGVDKGLIFLAFSEIGGHADAS